MMDIQRCREEQVENGEAWEDGGDGQKEKDGGDIRRMTEELWK